MTTKTTQRRAGFTIVELLIVIVVIGILAAITIVAYNGIQTKSNNTARASELRSWQKIFELYKAQEGDYPIVANQAADGYCLGVNFPNNKCRNFKLALSDITTYGVADSADLMAELEKVGSLPNNGRRPVINTYIGPYVDYGANNSTIVLRTMLEGPNGTCQSAGLQHNYTPGSGSYSICQIILR